MAKLIMNTDEHDAYKKAEEDILVLNATIRERLTIFQRSLLDEMRTGVWYDCYRNQGTDGAVLPDSFYRGQTQAMSTLRPMIEAGALLGRTVRGGWPQVRKII